MNQKKIMIYYISIIVKKEFFIDHTTLIYSNIRKLVSLLIATNYMILDLLKSFIFNTLWTGTGLVIKYLLAIQMLFIKNQNNT